MQIEIKLLLTGTRPMLQHNGRLANPLDPHTRRVAAVAKKRQKTDDDFVRLSILEARGGCWETADGLLGLPVASVWAAFVEAGTKWKLGKELKRALRFEAVTVPLLIGGAQVSCDDFVAHAANVDVRGVRVGQRRVMRARPLVPAGWQCPVEFTLDTDLLNPEALGPVIERAGNDIGIADNRPIFGTFRAAQS